MQHERLFWDNENPLKYDFFVCVYHSSKIETKLQVIIL